MLRRSQGTLNLAEMANNEDAIPLRQQVTVRGMSQQFGIFNRDNIQQFALDPQAIMRLATMLDHEQEQAEQRINANTSKAAPAA